MVSRLAPLLLTVAALLFMQCGPHRYPPGLLLLDSLADEVRINSWQFSAAYLF